MFLHHPILKKSDFDLNSINRPALILDVRGKNMILRKCPPQDIMVVIPEKQPWMHCSYGREEPSALTSHTQLKGMASSFVTLKPGFRLSCRACHEGALGFRSQGEVREPHWPSAYQTGGLWKGKGLRMTAI